MFHGLMNNPVQYTLYWLSQLSRLLWAMHKRLKIN